MRISTDVAGSSLIDMDNAWGSINIIISACKCVHTFSIRDVDVAFLFNGR